MKDINPKSDNAPKKQDGSPKYVAYLRVSTKKQGDSGLGLEAQRETVRQFVAGRRGVLIAPEFVEVETGKQDDRPELAKAMNRCRATGATLVVAKLDRLSRNVAFLMSLRDSKLPFVAADLPEANTMTIGVMAVVAQYERELISTRTRAALRAAKARGTKLGGLRAGVRDVALVQHQGVAAAKALAAARLDAVAADLRALAAEGLTLNGVAQRLNAAGIQASRGGVWNATAVKRALARL